MAQYYKTPVWVWVLMAVAGVLAVANIDTSKSGVGSQTVAVSTQRDDSPIPAPVGKVKEAWHYYSTQDDMTSKTVRFADLQSENLVNFDFPYQGEQCATLQIRRHPRYGNDVILSIQRGQFLTRYDGTKVLVRFDDHAPVSFTAFEPADHDSKVIFINGFARFITSMKKAKEVRIEAPFYREGTRVFEFNVDGFNESW